MKKTFYFLALMVITVPAFAVDTLFVGPTMEPIWVNDQLNIELLSKVCSTPKNILNIKKIKEGDTIYVNIFKKAEDGKLVCNGTLTLLCINKRKKYVCNYPEENSDKKPAKVTDDLWCIAAIIVCILLVVLLFDKLMDLTSIAHK